jgi:hypothetical protein
MACDQIMVEFFFSNPRTGQLRLFACQTFPENNTVSEQFILDIIEIYYSRK